MFRNASSANSESKSFVHLGGRDVVVFSVTTMMPRYDSCEKIKHSIPTRDVVSDARFGCSTKKTLSIRVTFLCKGDGPFGIIGGL